MIMMATFTSAYLTTCQILCSVYIYRHIHIYNVIGIATRYGLDDSEVESRWGKNFCTPVQKGPEAHPASYTMCTGSLSGW
jgi:hypothetical protein